MRLHKLLAGNGFSYIFVLGLDAVLISTISLASASASSIYNKESSISSSSYQNFNYGDGLDIDDDDDDDDDEGRQYYEGIPWQPSPSNLESIDEASRYEALDPIVFSPTGRLHPIEAAVKASKANTPLSNLVLAMRYRDGLLLISTIPTSPYLETRIDNTSIDDVDEKKVNVDTATATATSTTGSIKNDSKKTTNIDVNDDVDDSLLSSSSSSLFLFDETCLTTTTCPILDIHPCIVAATAGNAVDNKIMRTRLFALGVSAMETQGIVEEDTSVDQIVRDLANQLQVVTQDLAAAQKQGLDRMIASSAVVLGNQKIFRIDPTGQIWDMDCTVLGQDADLAEEELYHRLLEECSKKHDLQGMKNKKFGVREYLDSISHDEALVFAKEFLKSRVKKQLILQTPKISSNSQSTKNVLAQEPHPSSQVYWQAKILDYSSNYSIRRGKPRRISRRGTFVNRSKVA